VVADTASADGSRVEPGLNYPPLYYLALCAHADADFPAELEGAVALFGDAGESVYSHYNDEVRKHIAAGTRLAELEARLAVLTAERDALLRRCAELERSR
jgi:hypothetical protein